MKTIKKTEEFLKWAAGLNMETATRLDIRIARMEQGNYGDHKRFDGLLEIRFHFGPGYRLYAAEIGREIVLILVGGGKGTQKKDIKTAKKLKEEYGG
jgi:putative addiction module killer protein